MMFFNLFFFLFCLCLHPIQRMNHQRFQQVCPQMIQCLAKRPNKRAIHRPNLYTQKPNVGMNIQFKHCSFTYYNRNFYTTIITNSYSKWFFNKYTYECSYKLLIQVLQPIYHLNQQLHQQITQHRQRFLQQWCQQIVTYGYCTATGDPHITTFDGFCYHYMGKASYGYVVSCIQHSSNLRR